MKKNYMFQYYNYQIIEDTDLITKDDAYELWNKYLPEVLEGLRNGEEIQVCIWSGCDDNTDYHTAEKEIDYRDCVYENGCVYKVTKERLAL